MEKNQKLGVRVVDYRKPKGEPNRKVERYFDHHREFLRFLRELMDGLQPEDVAVRERTFAEVQIFGRPEEPTFFDDHPAASGTED